MMVTIKDVAKQAEVSVATVSRVLNKNGYVNSDTEKKVLQVIEDLNYKPNAVARSLFKKSSKSIALIIPDITNPFFPELARAVENTATKNGYTLHLYNSDDIEESEKGYLEILKHKYVDGVILSTNSLDKEHLESLEMPIVVLDRLYEGNVPTVISKNYEGGKLATRYLKEIGCKVISHIKGPENNTNAQDRYLGYLNEVKDEYWFNDGLVVNGDYNIKKSMLVTKKLLIDNPQIDGVFAGNDIMAIGALKVIHQMGKRVPEDISVIGFDGISLGEMLIPELTTIAQPIYKMGQLATDMLIDLIDGKKVDIKNYELDVELIKRYTTK